MWHILIAISHSYAGTLLLQSYWNLFRFTDKKVQIHVALQLEYWSGLPFPSPGDLPDPGLEPRSSKLQADSLPAEPQGKPRGSKSGPAGNSRKMVQIQLCGWEGFSWMGPLWSPVGYSQGDFCLQCWLLIFLFQYEIFKNHSNVCLHFCYKYSNIVDSLLFLSQSLFFSSFFLPGNHR